MLPSRRWFALALLPLSLLLLRGTPPSVPEVAVPGGVEVTPDAGGPLNPEANTSGLAAGFWVKNTRTVTTTYNLACGTTGTASSCEVEPMQVTLLADQITDISVTYSTGTAGGGTVVLRATGAAADTGYYNLTSLGQGYPGVVLKNQNDNNKDRSGCLVAGAGEAAWQCGDLLVSHGLPGYSTMGRERSLTMVYSSAQAVPKPLVAANVTNGDISSPVNVYAELRVGNSGGTQTVRATGSYSGWNLDPNPRQVALTYDASADPTGAYPFTLVVQNQYPGIYSTTRTGTLLVVNRSQSEFGAGWALAGVERLHFGQPVGTSNGDILWVGGDGSAKLYGKLNATTWVAPLGSFRDTIAYNSTTTEYTRTLRHKIQVVYDALGRHIRTINRMEQPTYFYWNSSTTKLDSVVVPPTGQSGTRYTLKYDGNGKIDSIADPVGRALNVTVTSGNTVTIRDPDLVTTTFTYSGSTGRMLTRTNRRNHRTRFEYANSLRVTKVHVPGGPSGTDTSTTEFKPWDEKGLPGQAAAQDSSVYTKILGPRSNVADDARFWVDKWGAPIKIIDAIGATTLLTRGNASYPQLVTRIDHPNGRIGVMVYGARGNLTEARDSTWHLATSARDSTRFTTYQYSDATNAPDSPTRVGESYNRYTYFTYNTLGLTSRIQDPRGLVTRFNYITSVQSVRFAGLLTSVVDSMVPGIWQESDSSLIQTDLSTVFTYDTASAASVGNLRTTMTPTGNVTTYARDASGRVTDTYDPLGIRTSYVYDAMNRVSSSKQYTITVSHPFGVTQSCEATQLFCADSSLAVLPSPDTLLSTFKLGAMTLDTVIDPRLVKRAFGYDAQGNQRIEQDEFGIQKIAFYDRGGLTDSIKTRDNIMVRFRYDVLGRRTFMGYPQRASPWAPSDNTITPGDSLEYSYDISGNLLTARNRWNNWVPISRTYYAHGGLKTKRTPNDSIFYEYDRNGARRRVIMNWGKDTVNYTYGPIGDLTTIIAKFDKDGGGSHSATFSFVYDQVGRRSQITYPGNIVATFAYDKNGTVRQIKSVNPASQLITDRFDFTWRNRQVDAAGRILYQTSICHSFQGGDNQHIPCSNDGHMQTTNRYNPLGMLVRQRQDGGVEADSMAYDRAGNMTYRRKGGGTTTTFTMAANSNRLATDLAAGVTVTHLYNGEGARIKETPSEPNQYLLYHWYYYDGLNRLNGSRYGTWTGSQIDIHQEDDRCRHNADGQLVLTCGNLSPVLYFDGDNVVGNSEKWVFVHEPGLDAPLVAIKRIVGGAQDAFVERELFFVTDGAGRQYAVGDQFGWIKSDDLQTVGGSAWQHSGTSTKANTFGAARMENSTLPGVSYFRNRAYDSRTGRWTQEDPIGLAGGINLYQFNGNNPVTFSDPFGLKYEDVNFIRSFPLLNGSVLSVDQGFLSLREQCSPMQAFASASGERAMVLEAAGKPSVRLRACLRACEGGADAIQGFCRKLPVRDLRVRAACWAVTFAGEWVCKGFCYAKF